MKLRNQQQGMTLISTVFVVAVFAFFGLLAFRLGPIYIQNFIVKRSASALQQLPKEKLNSYGPGVKLVLKQDLLKQLAINEIDHIKARNIKVTQTKQGYLVNIKYDVTANILANIDALIHFDDTVLVTKRAK